ncbi:MAG: long-chain fatty acid--CoA ligase [Pseudomonadota bacterium]|nr:long-chain fatty acid--CoA ligase [Pseudomonadota bacterium]
MTHPQDDAFISAAEAKTLPGMLLERARRSPDAVAYVQYDPASEQWEETTWRQTAEAVGRWQAALRGEELTAGDRVALMMSNRCEWVYFDMAALGLGLVAVPLYTNDRPENVRHVLEDAGVRLLLLETREQLSELAAIRPTLEKLLRIPVLEPGSPQAGDFPAAVAVEDWLVRAQEGGEGEAVDLVEHSHDLATIVYTSGTTGPPKGVMLSHHNLLWNAEASLRRVRAFPQDRFLSFLPLSHTLERTGGYYLPMMAGASVAYARSISKLAEDLTIIRPTVLISVPRIFERVHGRIRDKLENEPAAARALFEAAVAVGFRRFEHTQGRRSWSPDLLFSALLDALVGRKVRARLGGRLRVAVCGGAPLAPEIARFFIGLGIPLIQGYGLTEASPVVSVNPLRDNIPESVGVPLPGLEVSVSAQEELLVRSPGVMLGYWKQPQASTAAVDQNGWLQTGDQVRMDNRHLFITGRLKEVLVLSNGEKVPPSDLEMAIGMDRLFSQVLLIGEGRPYLAALVVLDSENYAKLAKAEGLDPKLSVERLSPRLEEILLGRAGARLKAFPGHATLRRMGVVEEPWSIADGFMTPTMKLKRARILTRYHEDVERIYEGHD